MIHPTLHKYKASFEPKKFAFDLNNTTDPIIKYGIYRPNDTNLGIIMMESFEPANNDVSLVIGIIRSLLVNELTNTSALVFDGN